MLLKDNSDGAQETQVEVRGTPATIGNTIGRPIPVLGALTSNIRLPLPVATGVVKGFTPAFDRVQAVLSHLLDIRTKGFLIDVFTTLRVYQNMAMTSLDVTRDAGDLQAGHFVRRGAVRIRVLLLPAFGKLVS
jgi:hypothetical protein